MGRAGWFVVGLVIGIIVLAPLGAYLFARTGGLEMATTAKPLPFEQRLADMALDASIGAAEKAKNPLPLDDPNMLAGVTVYRENCELCHGLPGHKRNAIAAGEFPEPPQFFESHAMVNDDPEGETYWKVTHGIRLSGMPGFPDTLSDTQRWQVTMLVSHADKLPPGVKAALEEGGLEARAH